MALAATPLLAVAATALVVNSRHVFYALSFPLHRVRGRLARTYATFGLTDEAYALTAGPQAQTWTTKRIVVLQLLLQSFWVAGATVGALAGTGCRWTGSRAWTSPSPPCSSSWPSRRSGPPATYTPPAWPWSAPSPPKACSPARCCWPR
jgi:hypothetical protein